MQIGLGGPFAAEEFGLFEDGMGCFLLLVGRIAVRYDPGLRNEYLHRCHTKAKGVAKVAAARKLAIRLYWMLRTNTGYPEVVRVESSSRVALVSAS